MARTVIYDAKRSRFISVDPAMDGQAWYGYGRNNPIRYNDPSGLFNKDTNEVEKGDTLFNIADANGISRDDIVAWNPQLNNINEINPGDKINMSAPGSGSSAGGGEASAPSGGGNSGLNSSQRAGQNMANGLKQLPSQLITGSKMAVNGLAQLPSQYAKGSKVVDDMVYDTAMDISEVTGTGSFFFLVAGGASLGFGLSKGKIPRSAGLLLKAGGISGGISLTTMVGGKLIHGDVQGAAKAYATNAVLGKMPRQV